MRLPAALALFLLGCGATTWDDPRASRREGVAGEAPAAGGPLPRDVPQSTFTGEGSACSNLLVYRASADGTQYLVVVVDRARLGLEVGAPLRVDLGQRPMFVEVNVDVYDGATGPEAYCSATEPAAPRARARWTAEAGALTILLSRDEGAVTPGSYRATLLLEGAHFASPEGGMAVVLPKVRIEDVVVATP
jgi:hypothetical protein